MRVHDWFDASIKQWTAWDVVVTAIRAKAIISC